MDVFSKVNKWLVWGMGIVFAMGFQSCLDDDNDNWYGKVIPNALVTVKNVDDGSFFLQLDDSTTLLPINVASSPFGEKEVRALVNYDEVDEVSGRYSKAVHINWIDSILTKPIAPDLGEENDKIYLSNNLEIKDEKLDDLHNWLNSLKKLEFKLKDLMQGNKLKM